MSTDYNYDEQGQFFPYFILVLSGIVTIPTTYSLLKPSKELENTAPRIQSDFKPENADLIEGQRRKQKRRERKLKRILVTSGGWLLMAWMVYLIIVTAALVPKIWDPYEVLGVSRSANEKQIKSHYRKLSVTQHPDKRSPDPAKNETYETINDHWVEIVKAFKTLTDDEIRNNYLQFGHPDGKQSFSIGIALPKFIISDGNGKYVLMLYGVVLGILLPWMVGKWWYGTQKLTKDKVLVASAGHLFREYDPQIDEGGVIAALSSGQEFKEMLKAADDDRGLTTIESRVLSGSGNAPSITELTLKDRNKLQDLEDGHRRKALGLLWAYLGRVQLGEQTLDDEKFEVAPIAHSLVESFQSITLAYGNILPLLATWHIAQSLIQAVLPRGSPLLQLPHFSPTIVKAVEGGSRSHLSIQQFMDKPAAERKRLAVGAGLLTEAQYASAVQVASQIPALRIEKAFFKVYGEKFVLPNSLIQFVIKARIIPPGSKNVPDVNEKDLEQQDEPEDKLKETDDSKRIQPQVAHAPYYARDYSPRWHIFLGDSKQGKIAVPPFTFSTFDKPIFNDDGTPTYNVQTLTMQFGAPPQAGRYTFTMYCVCDSYIGFDTKLDVVMAVEETSRAEEIESDSEPSEPDEGQLRAAKGETVSKPKKKRAVAQEDSDDESDTEGDVDTASETDTETDTDEE